MRSRPRCLRTAVCLCAIAVLSILPLSARAQSALAGLTASDHTRIISAATQHPDEIRKVLKFTPTQRSKPRAIEVLRAMQKTGVDAALKERIAAFRYDLPAFEEADRLLGPADRALLEEIEARIKRVRPVAERLKLLDELKQQYQDRLPVTIGLGIAADILKDGEFALYAPESKVGSQRDLGVHAVLGAVSGALWGAKRVEGAGIVRTSVSAHDGAIHGAIARSVVAVVLD